MASKFYIIIFIDSIGDSVFQGGRTSILGYMYPGDEYGTQLGMRFGSNNLFYRNQSQTNIWNPWRIIKTENM